MRPGFSSASDAIIRARPLFVVLEGLDGAGTTTQMELIANWLRVENIPVDATYEPTNGPLGLVARKALRGEIELDPEALALCLASDRRYHITDRADGILRSLELGRWVICDRYKLSSLAYQAFQGVEVDWLVEINRMNRDPDVTIFIDTPPEVCKARVDERNSHRQIFDDQDTLERVLESYIEVIERRGVGSSHLITVDGNRTKEEVLAEIQFQLVEFSKIRPQSMRTGLDTPQKA